MKNRNASKILLTFVLALAMAVPFLTFTRSISAAPPVTGAIFTTNSACTGTNINIFASKDAVYLDGGPAHMGAAGLPDGSYYVQVTEPNGTPLGHSPNAAVTVSGGEFVSCYQLSAILVKQSDGSTGYDSTSNPGGEYKVWVSMNPAFPNDESKTDSFKVREGDTEPPQGLLRVIKFYDVNA